MTKHKGRPKIDNPRNLRKLVRWTAGEWEDVERMAGAYNMTVSGFIRLRCLKN